MGRRNNVHVWQCLCEAERLLLAMSARHSQYDDQQGRIDLYNDDNDETLDRSNDHI